MSTIKVIMSPRYRAEREYVCHVLFHEFMGLSYEIVWREQDNEYQIECGGASITLPDVLFSTPEDKWLQQESFPSIPLQNVLVKYEGVYNEILPMLYGVINTRGKNYTNEIDILGSIFFLLSRYEETNAVLDDNFGRYDFKRSILYKEKLLNRPLVNEYVELLKSLLKRHCPCHYL